MQLTHLMRRTPMCTTPMRAARAASVAALLAAGSLILTGAPAEALVVAPQFEQPSGGETWTVGTVHEAKWDTSQIPAEARSYTGSLYLGYDDGSGQDDHVDLSHPLAGGFHITDGAVKVVVPKVARRSTYFLLLTTDSADRSQDFSIAPATTVAVAAVAH